jgi:hypothetical protein
MMAALRLDGQTACLTLEGTTDTESFRTYVAVVLLPMLRPGDLVVMDNLSPHKSEATPAVDTLEVTDEQKQELSPPAAKMGVRLACRRARRAARQIRRTGHRSTLE